MLELDAIVYQATQQLFPSNWVFRGSWRSQQQILIKILLRYGQHAVLACVVPCLGKMEKKNGSF